MTGIFTAFRYAPSRTLVARIGFSPIRTLSSLLGGKSGGWDPNVAVHGKPPPINSSDSTEDVVPARFPVERTSQDATSAADPVSRMRSAFRERYLDRGGGGGGGSGGDVTRAEMVQFQAYVRKRLTEIDRRMPKRPSIRDSAELSFLEQQVVEDHLSKVRKLRDPLRDVPLAHISHTNLPLLCRFVSEGGAILPRKLTGTKARKQRKVAKMIKRAQQLALLPITWKLPKYRHAAFSDDFSKPERPAPPRVADDDFADPPDIRFPGQFEDMRRLDMDLSRLARDTYAEPPPPTPGAVSAS
uniref:Ribosomal protein S18 n=1 Tax=Coccolithus braarudii TaxID=221442 RepID=A0A7S0LD58_9EUKA